MPHNGLIQRMLEGVAVYWPPGGLDDHGQRSFGTAVEIPCRWNEVTEEFLDRQGNKRLSKAKIYVGEDVEELGVIWQSSAKKTDPAGTALAELTDAADPFGQEKAYEIRRVDKAPNRRYDNFLRTVYV